MARPWTWYMCCLVRGCWWAPLPAPRSAQHGPTLWDCACRWVHGLCWCPPHSQLPQLTAEATASCHIGKPGCPEGLSLGNHITWHRLQLTGGTRELLNRGPTTLRGGWGVVAPGHCPNLGGLPHCRGLDPCQPFGGGQKGDSARGCHAFPAG